jgi:hypothetical protein
VSRAGDHFGGGDVKQILKIADLMEIFDCTNQQVEKLAREGVLPGLRIGRSWTFPAEALLSALNAKAVADAAERRGEQHGKPTPRHASIDLHRPAANCATMKKGGRRHPPEIGPPPSLMQTGT